MKKIMKWFPAVLALVVFLSLKVTFTVCATENIPSDTTTVEETVNENQTDSTVEESDGTKEDTDVLTDEGTEKKKEGFTEKLARVFAETLGRFLPKEGVILIISMIPILELRGGLIAASLLGVAYWKAVIFCVIGNIIPIPFILLFIKQVIKWMKKWKITAWFANWLEAKAEKKSSALKKGEFLGIMLFVGIPLPGTGAWTGSLIAALMDVDIKKAVLAELCGLVLATGIMSFITYALPAIISMIGR